MMQKETVLWVDSPFYRFFIWCKMASFWSISTPFRAARAPSAAPDSAQFAHAGPDALRRVRRQLRASESERGFLF
jgi:hypothetical protein